MPSFEEIKRRIQSFLPAFMQPDSIEEQRTRLQGELDEAIRKQEQYENANDRQRSGTGLRDQQSTIEELQRQLATLPEMQRGGIFNAAMSGSPVMLHGQEAVIPLDSTRGQQILSEKAPFSINRNNRGRELNARSVETEKMMRSGTALAFAPVVNAPSNVQNNQNTSFISQGQPLSFDTTYEPR